MLSILFYRWRQNTAEDPFVCEKCNCNGHSDKCHFDEEVMQKQDLESFGPYFMKTDWK